MNEDEAMSMYLTDKNYHDYVTKYCLSTGHTVHEAIEKYIVREVAKYYKNRKEGKE